MSPITEQKAAALAEIKNQMFDSSELSSLSVSLSDSDFSAFAQFILNRAEDPEVRLYKRLTK